MSRLAANSLKDFNIRGLATSIFSFALQDSFYCNCIEGVHLHRLNIQLVLNHIQKNIFVESIIMRIGTCFNLKVSKHASSFCKSQDHTIPCNTKNISDQVICKSYLLLPELGI